jgi:hypothetical protein
MSKFIRLRVFIGVVCLGVLSVSTWFANALFHSPNEGAALHLLTLLGEVAVAVCIVSLLGLIWAAFAPRWAGGLFRFAWGHLKYAAYVFYAMLGIVGIYAVVSHVFGH